MVEEKHIGLFVKLGKISYFSYMCSNIRRFHRKLFKQKISRTMWHAFQTFGLCRHGNLFVISIILQCLFPQMTRSRTKNSWHYYVVNSVSLSHCMCKLLNAFGQTYWSLPGWFNMDISSCVFKFDCVRVTIIFNNFPLTALVVFWLFCWSHLA